MKNSLINRIRRVAAQINDLEEAHNQIQNTSGGQNTRADQRNPNPSPRANKTLTKTNGGPNKVELFFLKNLSRLRKSFLRFKSVMVDPELLSADPNDEAMSFALADALRTDQLMLTFMMWYKKTPKPTRLSVLKNIGRLGTVKGWKGDLTVLLPSLLEYSDALPSSGTFDWPDMNDIGHSDGDLD